MIHRLSFAVLPLLHAFLLGFAGAITALDCLHLPLLYAPAAACCLLLVVLWALTSPFPRVQVWYFPMVLAAAAALLLIHMTDAKAFAEAVLRYLNGEGEALLPYALPAAAGMAVFFTCCALAAAQTDSAFLFACLLTVCCLLALTFTGRAAESRSVVPLLPALALCAVPRRAPLRHALPVCLLALALLTPLTPLAGRSMPELRGHAEQALAALRDRLFFTEARVPFSLVSAGWQPLGTDRLGGTAFPSDAEIMEVRVSGPALLRGAVHSLYTGTSFDDPEPGHRYLLTDPRFAALRDTLFDRRIPSASLLAALPEEEVSVRMLSEDASTLWLLQRFSLLDSGELVLYHSDTSEVFATRSLQNGDVYRFAGRRLTGDTPAIGSLVAKAAESAESAPDLSAFLALPEGVEEGVYSLAREAAGDAPDAFSRASRLCAWLREAYPYSLQQNEPPADRDFVSWFLLSEQRGYCTSFAAAMTVMARTLGLPSRYVEGYAVRPESGWALVTQRDAHAWAEIWFDGFGWLPFDPTPGSSSPQQEESTLLLTPAEPLTYEAPQPEPTSAPELTPAPAEPETIQKTESVFPWIALFAAGLCLLLALRMALCRPARLAHGLNAGQSVLFWYRVAQELLSCCGLPIRAGETPLAYLIRAEETVEIALRPLGESVERARYSRESMRLEDAAAARRACRALARRLTVRQRLKWLIRRCLSGSVPLED